MRLGLLRGKLECAGVEGARRRCDKAERCTVVPTYAPRFLCGVPRRFDDWEESSDGSGESDGSDSGLRVGSRATALRYSPGVRTPRGGGPGLCFCPLS